MDLTTILIIAGSIVVVALWAYMMFFEQFNIRVRELELSFPSLPPEFDGYTILHLSDLHVTKLGKLEKRTMEIIGGREIDACFVTGDVTANPRASDIWRRVCSAIRHRDPIFMVLGNSEHKPWLDTNTLVQALSFEGLVMLINSSATIRRGNAHISLTGVDDAYSRLSDVETAFSGVNPDDFIVFLTHCPSVAPDGIAKGADLVLAGHTHGGQVRFPLIGAIYTHMRSNKKLSDGLYTPDRLRAILRSDPGQSVLFVSRGVGTSRLHIRFLCRPEIAYITLRRGANHSR